ncbi:MAG: glutamate--tRNA ligase [Tepidisphaeraceae bacterium]
MSSQTIVTRFAPSPTGYLHVGGARTALFNWLLARHHGGRFLLRIEDTDLARSTQQACDQLLEDLKWLGLHWDNTAIIHQSKRLETYNRIIAELMSRGQAYEAWETDAELNARRQEAEKAKRAFIYRKPEYTAAQLLQFKSENRTSVVRFAMPVKEVRFRDVILDKDIVVGPDQVQDFVIRKSDGMPTYHFAVVVDDAEMGITHILRGQEHLLNTINHIGLQEALGYVRPTYGHLPIIMNIDGSKMSKRDRDKKMRHASIMYTRNAKKTPAELAAAAGLDVARFEEWLKDDGKQLDPSEHALLMPIIGVKEADLPEILVNDFRRNGYTPEVLLNFLSLLGWNPGGDRERMTVEELVQLFSIDGIGKGNARFDRTKLMAFSTQIADTTPLPRLVAAMRDYLRANPESPVNAATDGQLATLLQMKKGFRTLREVDEPSRFFFLPDEAIVYEPAAVEKVLKKNNAAGLAALRDARDVLAAVTNWKHDVIETAVKQFCDARALGLGNVAQPIRVALSGGSISPPIFHSLEFLGRDRTMTRIARCLAAVGRF